MVASRLQDHAGASVRIDSDQLADIARMPQRFAKLMERVSEVDLDKFERLLRLADKADDLKEVIMHLEDLPAKFEKLVSLLEQSDKIAAVVDGLNDAMPNQLQRIISLLEEVASNTGKKGK